MEKAWLEPDEQDVWRGFLRMNAWIYDELERDLRTRDGFSLIEYGILAHLSEAPRQRMRMRVLAETVIVSRSRLSHQIARLEREGHVRREHCEDDRRGLWAVLTERGASALDRAAPGHAAGCGPSCSTGSPTARSTSSGGSSTRSAAGARNRAGNPSSPGGTATAFLRGAGAGPPSCPGSGRTADARPG